MSFTLYKKTISATGTTIENEPIIKSDGAGDVMQWLSNNEASNITISEDGSNNLDLVVSAGNVGIGVTPTELFHVNETNTDVEEGVVVRLSTTAGGALKFGVTDKSVDATTWFAQTGSAESFIIRTGGANNRLTIDGSTGMTTITPTGNVKSLYLSGATATTDMAFRVVADSLTSGKVAEFYSNATSGDTRDIVKITNDHSSASGATCLRVRNDSTGPSILVDGGGIVETNGVLRSNLLSNSGFDVWSNSTLVSATTGAAPALEDAGDLVNAGTANSGTAWTGATGATPPTGWTATGPGTFTIDGSSGSGAEPGLLIVHNGTNNNPYLTRSFTTVVGKLYKLQFRAVKTDANIEVGIGTSIGTSNYEKIESTNTSWDDYSSVFEATTTSTFVYVASITSTSGQYARYDSFMLHEVTPGCVAANSLAPDGWNKNTTTDLFREHNGSNTQDGSFYSLKTVTAGTGAYVYHKPQTDSVWLGKVRGRTMTFGFWAKTSTASHVRIGWYDDSYTYSSYHTGGGGWEWLELTEAVDADAATVSPVVRLEASGATAYISQPMLVFGSAIGSGNYSRPSGEIVNCEKPINALTGYNYDSFSTTASTTLNTEALSSGQIPKGAKAIWFRHTCFDSGSAASVAAASTLSTTGYTGSNAVARVYCAGKTNDAIAESLQRVPCDSNGDVLFQCTATGSSTMDISIIPTAVELR